VGSTLGDQTDRSRPLVGRNLLGCDMAPSSRNGASTKPRAVQLDCQSSSLTS